MKNLNAKRNKNVAYGYQTHYLGGNEETPHPPDQEPPAVKLWPNKMQKGKRKVPP